MNDTINEYLTTRELADLLRIKERKVYALASSGDIPCTRATGKLLFPRRDIEKWLARASGDGQLEPLSTKKRAEVFLGSHDPLLEWALKQSGCHIASDFDGSMDGLDRFVNGDGIAAALHIYEAEQDDWNVNTVTQAVDNQQAVLVEFCWRQRGLVFKSGLASQIQSIDDLKGRTVAPRQQSAGSQILLKQLMQQNGVEDKDVRYHDIAYTETEAVMSVIEGFAEVTLGLESIAKRFDLEFIPLIRERFDLVVDRKAWFDPGFQTFIHFCHGDEFRQRAGSLAGYDVSGLGKVMFNS